MKQSHKSWHTIAKTCNWHYRSGAAGLRLNAYENSIAIKRSHKVRDKAMADINIRAITGSQNKETKAGKYILDGSDQWKTGKQWAILRGCKLLKCARLDLMTFNPL